jgi:very-short-patch-repair endonuclease
MRQFLATDRQIARTAANQHGVIRIDQLHRSGLSPDAIKRRVAAGRLHRLHRGVYAVGHTNLSAKGRLIAAVFAYGPSAVASHDSAAWLWSLSPRCPPFCHVTVPGTAGRAGRKGIVLHRTTTLTPGETTVRDGIRTTTRERTLADLGWDREPTRSHLERLFLRVIRDAGLPRPDVNARLGSYEVDFLWRAERLVAELDGYAYHSSREQFAADRRRDRELQRRGYVVLRFTYEEVTREPEAVLAALRAELAKRHAA